jgi:3',5'-cyclic AMP phosphodiesterase CpdA
MRIAHLSDPHLLDLTGVAPARLVFGKRLTGYLTIKLHRGGAHRSSVVSAMVADINAQGVDHVVVTGDLTNLSLESEFAFARRTLEQFAVSAAHVSVVPGNHDVYTRGAARDRRFSAYLGAFATSDLPIEDAGHPSGPFPFVRLRGPVAIVGVSTAVARPPLCASGRAGSAQRAALARILAHPEVRRRTPVVLVHHPLINPRGFVVTPTHGLPEAGALRRLIGDAVDHALVLHGHTHERVHRTLRARNGAPTIHHIGATSASLVHRVARRMAGYNVYDIDDAGRFRGAAARVWDATRGVFAAAPLTATGAPTLAA